MPKQYHPSKKFLNYLGFDSGLLSFNNNNFNSYDILFNRQCLTKYYDEETVEALCKT